MNITDIKIRKLFTEGRIRAVVSIILDNDFAVHDLKVIEGIERLFVAMPNRKSEDGRFQDIVHPITSEAREQLEEAVLEKYRQALETPRQEE
ncbi:MAG: septation regulator SpoVG [Clostridia bacterium]|nr:septation regulator SpoVG [Clostridia bacterium]MDR3644973.1 septation regulator SpoVG [Clostridia bacterium]